MVLQRRSPYLLKLQARGALSELQQSCSQWDLPSLPPVDSCSGQDTSVEHVAVSSITCVKSHHCATRYLLFTGPETPLEEGSGDISRMEKAMCPAKAILSPRSDTEHYIPGLPLAGHQNSWHHTTSPRYAGIPKASSGSRADVPSLQLTAVEWPDLPQTAAGGGPRQGPALPAAHAP